MQKHVDNLVALKIDCGGDDCYFLSLTGTTLLATYTVFLTQQNSAYNSLSGSIPPEIGSLTNLEYLYFSK